jgi:hypothetical protein
MTIASGRRTGFHRLALRLAEPTASYRNGTAQPPVLRFASDRTERRAGDERRVRNPLDNLRQMP